MTNSMIERVAKQIGGAASWEASSHNQKEAFCRQARRILTGMREPTAYMVEIAEREYNIVSDGIARPIFSTMIDAALAEEG
jgi:hypothetical protein